MGTEQMSGELLAMQMTKQEVCVSIIVPTHRNEPERKADSIILKQAVEKAANWLQEDYPKTTAGKLVEMIKDLCSQADLNHHKDGLGIFVSPNMKLLKEFPFPVTEKVIIGDSFEIRDLLMEVQYSTPYFLLLLTRKVTKLFIGEMDSLSEMVNDDFPKEFVDEYEYNRPNPASSYSGRAEKGFEKDKSILAEIRFDRFMQNIDGILDRYLGQGAPLIICGEKKELANFQQLTDHKKNIAGQIEGSYAYLNEKGIADMAWPIMRNYLDKYENKVIREFEDKIGTNSAVTGLENIWKAVVEGRGWKLLVERDFYCPGFVDSDGYNFYLQPPAGEYKKLADAVDDLIEKTIETKGEVVFVQNNKLKDHDRIGLVTRY